MTEKVHEAPSTGQIKLHPARIVAHVILGIVLGVALFPALLELLALAGNVSPFKYQGF